MPSSSSTILTEPNATSTKNTTLILVVGMLISGVCNTIMNKYQDMQCVENCNDSDPANRRYFEQPVWQTLNMFVGEAAVWIVYCYQVWERRRRHQQNLTIASVPPSSVNQLDAAAVVDDEIAKHADDPRQPLTGLRACLLWIPTLCDMTATTIMSVGLLFTSASIYQMLRGSIVIFTGIASYLFLQRRLKLYEWVSLVMVVSGVAVVGLSSVLYPQNKPSTTNGEGATFDAESLLGVALVLGAQLFTATQFVVEEKIMSHYKVTPLKAVGLEGTFGLVSVLVGMPILHVLFSRQNIYFDVVKGFHDFFDNPAIWQIGIAIATSIAFFNWFGLSITTSISATARSTIDTSRTLFIWIVSLCLGWERFSWIQVVGFAIMALGTFYFNGVIRYPFAKDSIPEERTPLLRNDDNAQYTS
ncbi:hypothetical protein BCR43DRAFT_485667 [Syncephalastrum racemosum]|uniref:Integral membrane protein n=1 Tax=Syncephalastrum racemosum TaxID=13706 RepID=A0A1X2HN06_SYNRA|nr:hypothetical protein BCR43DRAFT_485667 [Syncephalastrum racemosum]